MRESIKSGLSFGLTSGIITTLGLMVGLYGSVGTKLAIIGGILTIAIADSFSDALGVSASARSSVRNGRKAIFESAIAAFFMKFLIALSFVIPLLFIDNLVYAIKANLLWGFILTTIFSVIVAKMRKESPTISALKNIILTTIIIVITFFAGKGIAYYFG